MHYQGVSDDAWAGVGDDDEEHVEDDADDADECESGFDCVDEESRNEPRNDEQVGVNECEHDDGCGAEDEEMADDDDENADTDQHV